MPLAQRSLPGLLAKRGYRGFQTGKFWPKDLARAGFSGGTKGADATGRPFARAMGGDAGLDIGKKTMQLVYDFLDTLGSEPFFLCNVAAQNPGGVQSLQADVER